MSNINQKSIRRPSAIAQKFSKEDLEKVWGNGGKSFDSLGKLLKVCPKALKHQMIEYGILPYIIPEKHKYLTKELLEEEYKTADLKTIAKKHKVSSSTINLLFDHFNIERKHFAYSVKEDFFDAETPEVFYVAGLWAGDGSVYQHKECVNVDRIQLGLKEADKPHLERIKGLLGFMGNLVYKENDGHPAFSLEIGSVKMALSLQKVFEIGERKSLTYKMPKWLLTHPLVNYFLLGYFDADGGFYLDKSGYDAQIGIRGTVDFLQQYHGILFDRGIVKQEEKITKISSGIGRLVYGGIPNCYQIYSYLHQNSLIHLDRKYKQFLQIKSKFASIQDKKVMRETRNGNIIHEFTQNSSVAELSDKYEMHPTSVANLLRKELGSAAKIQSRPFYEPILINGQKLNKLNILALSIEQREQMVDDIFALLRQRGLQPNLPLSEIQREYKLLQQSKITLHNGIITNFTSVGDIISKVYCPRFYKVKIGGRCSVQEAFDDDMKLQTLIRSKLGLDKRNGHKVSQITPASIINDLKSLGFCLTASLFKSSTAKTIYEHFTGLNDVILDYSAGWGGRMLGAAACSRKYIGIDPLNSDSLANMMGDLGLSNVTLMKGKSEEIILPENSIDFAFSSPPYFNLEIYDDNEQHALNNEEYFYEIYWKKTLENIQQALKPNKLFGVNVRNCEQMLEMAQETFGKVVEEVKISTPVSHLAKKSKDAKTKYEVVYLYANNK